MKFGLIIIGLILLSSCKNKICNDHRDTIVGDYTGSITQCGQTGTVETTLTEMEYVPSGISFRLISDSIAVDTFYVFELTCDPDSNNDEGLLVEGQGTIAGRFEPSSKRITLNLTLPNCPTSSFLNAQMD